MMLKTVRNDDLDYQTGQMYTIATSDILPDIILVPVRSLYGDFNWEDVNVPEYYEKLGYESRNYIVCTGSIPIMLTLIAMISIGNEILIGIIILKCCCISDKWRKTATSLRKWIQHKLYWSNTISII